jgi:transcriptional regulator
MYLPPHFAQTNLAALQALMRTYGFATVVTMTADGLAANHVPLEYDPEPAPHGTLRGHVARANPMWRETVADVEALAIFQGPQAYVSPSWYASKTEHGRVVPTYNYLVVHAYGPLQVVDDPAWLHGLVGRLTSRYEAERLDPWHVSDAPGEFISGQLRAIVGIEIPVTRLVGKWKVSQNRTPADRAGVVDALRRTGDAHTAALADAVEETLGGR